MGVGMASACDKAHPGAQKAVVCQQQGFAAAAAALAALALAGGHCVAHLHRTRQKMALSSSVILCGRLCAGRLSNAARYQACRISIYICTGSMKAH